MLTHYAGWRINTFRQVDGKFVAIATVQAGNYTILQFNVEAESLEAAQQAAYRECDRRLAA